MSKSMRGIAVTCLALVLLALPAIAQAAYYFQLYEGGAPTTTSATLSFPYSVYLDPNGPAAAPAAALPLSLSVLSTYAGASPQQVVLEQSLSLKASGKGTGMWYTLSGPSSDLPDPLNIAGAKSASAFYESTITTGAIYSLNAGVWASLPGSRAELNLDMQVLTPDTPPASTPIPAAVWLMGSGLMGLVGLRKKFRA